MMTEERVDEREERRGEERRAPCRPSTSMMETDAIVLPVVRSTVCPREKWQN